MKRTPMRRSSLFLLECIIAILFFILAATVCVRLFAQSYQTSQESQDLTMAVQITSSYVEEFRAGASFPAQMQVYYDDTWSECDKAEAAHTLTITMTEKEDMILGHFVMDDLFETSLDKYVGGQTP